MRTIDAISQTFSCFCPVRLKKETPHYLILLYTQDRTRDTLRKYKRNDQSLQSHLPLNKVSILSHLVRLQGEPAAVSSRRVLNARTGAIERD